eukprot:superscaffoldBa00003734_g17582
MKLKGSWFIASGTSLSSLGRVAWSGVLDDVNDPPRSAARSPFLPSKLDPVTKRSPAPLVTSISGSRGRDRDLCSGQPQSVY